MNEQCSKCIAFDVIQYTHKQNANTMGPVPVSRLLAHFCAMPLLPHQNSTTDWLEG